jgi:hypothetical protein
MDSSYPEGYEAAWLALDAKGYVGIFITAGSGPIPEFASSDLRVLECSVEQQVLRQMEKITGAKLVNPVGDYSSFAALAERGMFVFDWKYFDRTAMKRMAEYEVVAIPNSPIEDVSLPNDLRELAKKVKFSERMFELQLPVFANDMPNCLWPKVGG